MVVFLRLLLQTLLTPKGSFTFFVLLAATVLIAHFGFLNLTQVSGLLASIMITGLAVLSAYVTCLIHDDLFNGKTSAPVLAARWIGILIPPVMMVAFAFMLSLLGIIKTAPWEMFAALAAGCLLAAEAIDRWVHDDPEED